MPTICIIDDDDDSNMIITSYLEEKWDVDVYQQWEKAINSLEENPPEILLLDISMPGTSGIDALNNLRTDGQLKYVKVIALTSYSLPGDREKFLKMGFDDYLPKPVNNKKVLINFIEKFLYSNTK